LELIKGLLRLNALVSKMKLFSKMCVKMLIVLFIKKWNTHGVRKNIQNGVTKMEEKGQRG
jgi:hypothetical protein